MKAGQKGKYESLKARPARTGDGTEVLDAENPMTRFRIAPYFTWEVAETIYLYLMRSYMYV